MGGSGGGGGGGYSRATPPTFVASSAAATPSSIVNSEIARTMAEARRVAELLDALQNHKPGDLVLCALNAGQGDCCVMKLPNGEIVVVDCNVKAANVNVVAFLKKAGVRKIDLLILTHPDHDHVSGLTDLAKNFAITRAIDGRFRKEDAEGERKPGYEDYRRTIESMKASGTTFLPRSAIHGDVAELGSVKLEFLAPHGVMQAADANEASLCFRLRYGERTAIFGGDVTQKTWEEIRNREGSKLKSDILWASHHGAESGCDPKTVRTIAPKLTIVSVGDNTYGHPHPSPMGCYEKNSSQVRRTDDGSVGVVTSEDASRWKEIV